MHCNLCIAHYGHLEQKQIASFQQIGTLKKSLEKESHVQH